MAKKEKKITAVASNEYKDKYGALRNSINSNKAEYEEQLKQTRVQIDAFKKNIEILTTKAYKLEGAIETHTILLKTDLPSNNKINGKQ